MKNINKAGSADVTQHRGASVQPFFWWKNSKYYIFWVCVCSLRFPACNTHAPYCHLWLIRIFGTGTCLHYPINGTIVGGGGETLNIKCAFWLCQQILSTTFLILKRTERDIKNIDRPFLWSTHYSCQVSMRVDLPRCYGEVWGSRDNPGMALEGGEWRGGHCGDFAS